MAPAGKKSAARFSQWTPSPWFANHPSTMKPHYIPAGSPAVTPYLIVADAARAIEFYIAAFAATDLGRIAMPDGKIGHAELQIGDSRIMLADEFPDFDAKSPLSIGGTPVSLMLYVSDCDAVIARAVELGATATQPLENKFYGDRNGGLTDPFGHKWTIATHVEDVPLEEIQKRAAALFGGG